MQARCAAGKLPRSVILWRQTSAGRGSRQIKSWVRKAQYVREWSPLYERPPCSVVPARKVFEWRDATLEASSKPKTSIDQTGRPSSRELQIEMRWLLEDSTVARGFELPEPKWNDCCWGDLEIESHKWRSKNADVGGGECLQMRLSLEDLTELWRKRIYERVPIQYLTNTAHWRDLVLCVGPGILIPRPETESLIDLAEEHVKANGGSSPWMDMGTGSGAIAIALAKMLGKRSKVFAIDLSPTAVQCARKNAHRCAVAEQVVARRSKWFDSIQDLKGKLGGILSNPPYIPRADLANLQAEVGDHEPVLALDGGPGDGTEHVMKILKTSAIFLVAGGFMGLETNGEDQSRAAMGAVSETGFFEDVRIHADYYGVERFVTARRR
ncbi:hypothetical protein BSKO_07090 [Bryopsis sp. KO-2023]|nr:hypothetical protein BSKO_07090 [Bryopsis sp. KO-2023]